MKTVSIDKIIERFQLEVLHRGKTEQVAITSDLNRVGLQLAGHFQYFSPETCTNTRPERVIFL